MTGGPMREVCAWCGRVVEEGKPGQPTTHTVCPECFDREIAALETADERDRLAPIDIRD